MSHITSNELALRQAQGFDFELLDVRRARGHEIDQGLTADLQVLGVDARWRVGGMQVWLNEARPTALLASEAAAS